MSDNPETATQGGGEATATPEPAAPTAAAPAAQGAEPTEPTTEPTESDGDRAAKRIRQLAHRYAGEARRADELAARLAQLEQAQRTPQDADFQKAVEAEAERRVGERHARERVEAFHEAGRQAFPDWQDRCSALMAMGADAQLSQLLVEMKDGAKVAASLHDDPDELERIARLSTPTARAIALGVYAGRLEAAGSTGSPAGSASVPAGRTVSRAPAPIRPVTGRAAPVFNEYTAGNSGDGNATLVEFYAKQERIRRGLPA